MTCKRHPSPPGQANALAPPRYRPFSTARALASAGLATALACPPSAAHAQQATACAASPVVARGEPSRYEWLAKTKARANWRQRVRLNPQLGPAYSDWKLAADIEEKCLSGGAGTVCILTGTPCRK